jgi:acyl-CoA thioesterase-1
MMLRVFLFILLWSVAAAHGAALLVFGDSLSSSYRLNQGAGWVDLLRERLEENRYDYKVVNASVTGETTAGGRTRIITALTEHKPDIVVLELGANDGLRGATVESIRSNLTAMIVEARNRGARVLLVGMQLPPNYGTGYTGKFRDMYRAISKSERVALVPFMLEGFADDRSAFLDDGIHPGPAAQRRILDTVWSYLEPMLRERAARTPARSR